MKISLQKALVLVALAALGMAACDDETKVCNSKTDTKAVALFRYIDTSGKTDVVRDTVLPKLTIFALDKDSIYRQQAGYRSASLPMTPLADSSRFYIRAGDAFKGDTITFRYSRVPHFISAGCGFVTYYNIDTIFTTYNQVDSLVINSKQVTTDNATTISLFF